jgi:hypothetical protein
MTIEQLKTAHSARPFRPLTIHMGDGRSFRVEHPEFLSQSPAGRTVVYQWDERRSILDLLLATELEFDPISPAGRDSA